MRGLVQLLNNGSHLLASFFNIPHVSKILRAGFLLCMYALLSAFLLHVFMEKWSFREDDNRNSFVKMMNYSADRPWAYRILIPVAVNTVVKVIPQNLKEKASGILIKKAPLSAYMKFKNTAELTGDNILKYHILYFISFICIFSTLVAFWYLTKIFFSAIEIKTPIIDIGPILFIFLPLSFLQGGYFYDFVELLFASISLILIVRKKYIWFFIFLPVTILNKESDLLFITYFIAFAYYDLSRVRFFTHLLLGLIVPLGVIILIKHVFSDNPGFGMEMHWKQNFFYYSNVKAYFLHFYPIAPLIPFPRGLNAFSILIVGWVVFSKWSEKPKNLKMLLFLTSLVTVPLFFWACFYDELRNLSIMFPALYLAAFHSFFYPGFGSKKEALN